MQKRDKKGLSTTVVTLILIVLSLVAVGAVWILVNNLIKDQSSQSGLDKITFSGEIKQVLIDNSSNNVSVTVERKVGEGDLKGMKFIFSNDTGEEVITEYFTLTELQEKKISFHLAMNVLSLTKVSIVPLFYSSDGKEMMGNVADVFNVGSGGGSGVNIPQAGNNQTNNSTNNQTNQTCIPLTCLNNCGFIFDGCNETINCGECERNIGINLFASQLDYVEDRMFADIMKTARKWTDPYDDQGERVYGNGEQISVDEYGWPTGVSSAEIIVWHGRNKTNGLYYIEGYSNTMPSISAGFGGGTISNFSYNNQKFSAILNYSSTGSNGLLLTFLNIGGWVKDVKIMRPLYPGASSWYPIGTNFTTQIKELVNKFNVVRFLWSVDGWNGPWQQEWEDRINPNYCSFSRGSGDSYQVNGVTYTIQWAGKGTAWESAIQFANEVGKDMWIIMPIGADDNYIRQLATLIKNTYTVPNGKIYWEYSNEATWDMMGQTNRYLKERGTALGAAGDPISYDGQTNVNTLAVRYYAQRAMQMSKIWREVWGDANMMTRVRPVISGQLGYNSQLSWGLDFLNGYYNNGVGNNVADPHPVNYYFYGAGGSHYTGDDPDSIVNATSSLTEIEDFEWKEEEEACLAKMYGLKRVAYEGGVWTDNSRYQLPIITEAMIRYHALWDKYGGDLLAYFVSTGGEDDGTALGFTKDIFNLNTRKFEALDTIKSTSKPAVLGGKLLPGTLQGADYSYHAATWIHPKPKGEETFGTVEINEWQSAMGYLFRVNSEKDYKIKINYRSSQNDNVEIIVDGVVITRSVFPSSSSNIDSPEYTVNLDSGMHAIRIKKYTSGYFRLNNITIS